MPPAVPESGARFDPLVAAWFERRFGAPTEIQRLAWPRILAGEHLLFTAPTGSGKTLAGFLAPLDRLLTGAWAAGTTRVVYVSPLKALNSDIERNLRAPLAELTAAFEAAGRQPPALRVGVRSGDTPPAERARMLRRPPEILITTPESLNLLLLSKRAGALFAGLRLVILDEIHALYGTKRGVHLITAVERLTRIAGEFQRVAISATVRPLDEVARFVGGRRIEAGVDGARFEPRPVAVVAAAASKRYELAVRTPFAADAAPERRAGDAFWRTVAADLVARIGEVRSTLVFTNSRRMAEKLTRFVNEEAGRELAWSHHGSLSRELRFAVETRLKEGKLPAIVATSSLELGIDIGALDRVILLQTPRSLASAAQRIGRSGHRAGETSRAIVYPTHPRDFLDAAVVTRAVVEGEIEPLRPLRAPLDLLAQLLLSMVAVERWRIDELFDAVRASETYRDLSRRQFDLVVEMLAGRYADARVEELRPRVIVDRIDGTIAGRAGLATLLARAGGTIPDRGYFQLRLDDSRALLGELDEEFVWERSVGDSFTLGAQSWRIRGITANEVLVAPARGGAALAPFWKADASDRNAFVSERVARFLEAADRRVGDPALAVELVERHAFEPGAAAELVRLLGEERAALGVALPHRHHLVIEESREPGGRPLAVDAGGAGRDQGAARRQVVLYTFWGGTVNRPLALALAALWEEREGDRIETLSDDDAVLLVLPPGGDARALLEALAPERIEELLRAKLESSGFFGALFRQNAQRALLLPRAAPQRRTPLWIQRQNAKRLLDAVEAHDDFPVLVETWRGCLQDEFELDVLRERLRELAAGEIRVSSVVTDRPSPFAAGLVWQRTNELMYADDVADGRRAPRVAADLVREVALDAHGAGGRPTLSRALAERYRATAQRLCAGYPPGDADELLDWVRERLWIPISEWRELLAAIDAERDTERDAAGAAGEPSRSERWENALAPKLVRLWAGTPSEAIAALESALALGDAPPLAAAFAAALSRDARAELVAQAARRGATSVPATGAVSGFARALRSWLRFQPAVERDRLPGLCGASAEEIEAALGELSRAGQIVSGPLVEGAPGEPVREQVAALSSYETLLRWRRAAARPSFRTLPLALLPLWLAHRQKLTVPAGSGRAREGDDGLRAALEPLLGFPAPAALWESEILPARLDPYYPAWLDALCAEGDLRWLGVGPERSTFSFVGDFDLFPAASRERSEADAAGERRGELERTLVAELGRAPSGLDLGELAERTGGATDALSGALWSLAWRGEVVHEAFRTLRQGIASGFRAEAAAEPAAARPGARGGGRAAFRRWSATRALSGRWLAVGATDGGAGGDPLAEEERSRERVRRLAARYGVLFRELLATELPALSWARLARTMRTLELGGELVAGRFFDGVPGLQFASPAVVAELEDGLPEGALFWHGAADPASCCGLDLPELKRLLPQRRSGTWLVWRGASLVAVARRGGAELELRVAANDPALGELIAPYRVALARAVAPERALELETINGEPAASSPFLRAFDALSRTRESGGRIRLRRSYTG